MDLINIEFFDSIWQEVIVLSVLGIGAYVVNSVRGIVNKGNQNEARIINIEEAFALYVKMDIVKSKLAHPENEKELEVIEALVDRILAKNK